MIIWYCRVYNQIASDVWRYNNSIYKLMTNNEQKSTTSLSDERELMLINVLIRSFLNTKVLQGSVSTRLSCDGIFNDQFITQSLLSPKVKKIWKSVNICRSYGKLSRGSFLWNTVYNCRLSCSHWGPPPSSPPLRTPLRGSKLFDVELPNLAW